MVFAVHISDGVLVASWQAVGFFVAALLALWGGWRIRDEEIPRIAVLGSVFFVASLIHVRVGPTSVHLLLNGLVGVMLGRRACLAIPIALALQMALASHGGWGSLGVNSCVLTLPALAAALVFTQLQRLPARAGVRASFVWCSAVAWLLSLVFGCAVLATNPLGEVDRLDPWPAVAFTLQPLVLAACACLGLVAVWLEQRLENKPEFAMGLLVGVLAVLLTLALHGGVLLLGGVEDFHTLILLEFVAHAPIVVIEACVVGFTVSFLVRVKPSLLGWRQREEVGAPHQPRTKQSVEAQQCIAAD